MGCEKPEKESEPGFISQRNKSSHEQKAHDESGRRSLVMAQGPGKGKSQKEERFNFPFFLQPAFDEIKCFENHYPLYGKRRKKIKPKRQEKFQPNGDALWAVLFQQVEPEQEKAAEMQTGRREKKTQLKLVKLAF